MLEGAGAGPACVGVSSEDIDRWGDPSSWLGSFGAMHPPLLAQHLRACSYEVVQVLLERIIQGAGQGLSGGRWCRYIWIHCEIQDWKRRCIGRIWNGGARRGITERGPAAPRSGAYLF